MDDLSPSDVEVGQHGSLADIGPIRLDEDDPVPRAVGTGERASEDAVGVFVFESSDDE